MATVACFGKRDLPLPQPIGQFQLRQHSLALAVAERVGFLLRGAGGHDDHAVLDLRSGLQTTLDPLPLPGGRGSLRSPGRWRSGT